MQDNDPKHASRLNQRYIKNKKEQHIFQLMSWPVQSADLNPIEMVWGKLDRKVRTKQPTSTTHLWRLLQESRTELSSVYDQSLVEGMLKICKVVIAAKGGHILMNQKFRKFLVFFWLNLYLILLKKTCI